MSLQFISVVESDEGKCSLVFLEDKERLNIATYTNYFKERVLPWSRAIYGDKW